MFTRKAATCLRRSSLLAATLAGLRVKASTPSEYGEVITEVPKSEGSNQPYPLPQLEEPENEARGRPTNSPHFPYFEDCTASTSANSLQDRGSTYLVHAHQRGSAMIGRVSLWIVVAICWPPVFVRRRLRLRSAWPRRLRLGLLQLRATRDDNYRIPYYALYPPVYYSYPVARPYGYSPFAYPPGTMTPTSLRRPPWNIAIRTCRETPRKPQPTTRPRPLVTAKMYYNPYVTSRREPRWQVDGCRTRDWRSAERAKPLWTLPVETLSYRPLDARPRRRGLVRDPISAFLIAYHRKESDRLDFAHPRVAWRAARVGRARGRAKGVCR